MAQEITGLSSRMFVLDSEPYLFRLMFEIVYLDGVLSEYYGFPLAESFL
jgi:hypothetical protein